MDRLEGIRAESSFKFLRLLREKPADKSTLGRQLEFTKETIDAICSELEYRKLIEYEPIGEALVISRAGYIAVEQVLSDPDKASTHFPPFREMIEGGSIVPSAVEQPLSDQQAHLIYGAIRSEYSTIVLR